jgi:hypothetical protein
MAADMTLVQANVTPLTEPIRILSGILQTLRLVRLFGKVPEGLAAGTCMSDAARHKIPFTLRYSNGTHTWVTSSGV